MAGLFDSLNLGGGGLLDFLRFLQQPQQNSFSGLPSDQAQYGDAPQYAPMQANAQMMPQQRQPMPAPSPQQFAPQQQPAPQMQSAPPSSGGNFLGNLSAGFQSLGHGGSILGLLSGNPTDPTSQLRQTQNQTAHYLVSKQGMDPALAQAVVSDPAALRSILPNLMGGGGNQQATAAYLRSIGAPEAAIAAAVGTGSIPGDKKVLETLLTKYANQEKIRPMNAAERQAYGVPENTPASIDTTTGKPAYGPANTNVSTVINGEKEQDKVVGKGYGELQMDIRKAGYNAPAALGTLNLMEKQIKNDDFYSGQGGESATALKRLAVSLGIAGADTAAPNELFQKLSKKSVLDAAGGSLGANFSNGDRDFIEATVANIGNTKEGNKQIIEVGRQVHKRNIEIARQARAYAKDHDGRLDAGFDEQIANYAEKNPLFANIGPASSAAPNAQPDLSKAQKAPDGNTYVPDPARPGKYLKVVQ